MGNYRPTQEVVKIYRPFFSLQFFYILLELAKWLVKITRCSGFLILGLVEFSGSAYILHTATDSASTPLMLASSIPRPVSSPVNLSDQYKAISRNVEMVALDLVSVLFALTKVFIAMSVGRSMAHRMFERWGGS